ncbi:MAG: DUF3313 domain-containing protein [Rhodospirillaceae bacterium]|nr:DUF3313 domain-containing protein [Rhodospirillales bacterium]
MNVGDTFIRGLACGALAAFLAACSSGPDSPSGLAAQGPEMQSAERVPGAVAWRSPDLDASKYSQFVIPPVKIYDGADADFGQATPEDKRATAAFMQQEFQRVIGEQYQVASREGPKTARLELTLAGMSDNIPVASSVASIAPIGLVRNLATGSQSTVFSGSVTYKGEVYDSQTGKLVAAFVSTKTPPPLDLGATVDSRTAQMAAITDAAKDVRDAIQNAQQTAAQPMTR